MASDICVRLGKRIRALRKARGWRLIDLAQHCGVKEVHLSYVERGKREVGFNALVSIANGLGVKLSDGSVLICFGTLILCLGFFLKGGGVFPPVFQNPESAGLVVDHVRKVLLALPLYRFVKEDLSDHAEVVRSFQVPLSGLAGEGYGDKEGITVRLGPGFRWKQNGFLYDETESIP